MLLRRRRLNWSVICGAERGVANNRSFSTCSYELHDLGPSFRTFLSLYSTCTVLRSRSTTV